MVNFSCGNCGQRYRSADDPQPGHLYRVPCLVCDATVLVAGGDFPALPTAVADPAAARDPAGTARAGGEEPVVLTLAHMAQRDTPPDHERRLPGKAEPRRAVRVRRWSQLAAGGGIAIATVGAGVLLFGGEPSPAPRREAAPPRAASRAVLLMGGAPSLADSGASPRAAASPARPPRDRREPAPASQPAPVAEGPGPSDGIPPASGAPAASSRPPTPEEVDAAVVAKRSAFDACLREMRRNQPGFQVAGLAFDMVMTVNPSGIVTAPRIEDQALRDTVLGECFRDVGRTFLFPQFAGEPFEVRIPFRVGG